MATQWIIAAGLVAVLAIALPRAIAAATRSSRGKGRMAGATLALGLAFSVLFDPRKQEVVERTGKRDAEGEASGERDKGGEDAGDGIAR